MAEVRVDLKQLVLLINDQKEIDVNLNLDEGCVFFSEDTKPLVKVINYAMNFLLQLTDSKLNVSLELRDEIYVLNFIAFTRVEEIPEISPNLGDALKQYSAGYEPIHEKGNYFQLKFTFERPKN